MAADAPHAHDNDTGWRPGTPPVTAEDFASCPLLVVHYWATWDIYDREMDRRLAPSCEEFTGRICFRACDIDRAENRPFIHGLANVPALGLFVRGTLTRHVIGLRETDELRRTFEKLLAQPEVSAAGQRGIRALLSNWFSRRDAS